jgi:imidazolonepropionase-like amidohydrolase
MILNRRIRRREFMALAAAMAAFAALGARQCATASTLALRNARLWSGQGDRPIDGTTVAMLGPTIIAVGPDAEVDLGRDTRVIDCAGAFVMPGVMDTHVHVTEPLLRGNRDLLPAWLAGGVTTIRDTGTVFQGPQLLRDLLAQHGAPVPRVIATGGLMTAVNGYPTSRGPTGIAGSLQVADVAEAIAGVNATVDAGGEFIKIAVETGIPGGRLIEEAGAPTLTLEQVRAIVETAHARGVIVIAHVTNESELRRAIEGGVDGLAHTPLDPIPADLRRMIVERQIPMTGTLNIWGGGTLAATARTNVADVLHAGGIVAMGTDFPFQVHAGMPIDEITMMSGSFALTNEEVLLACTRDAARACARNDLGVIQHGRIADALILDADPLEDLNALSRVRSVIHDGVVVR